ncbi:phage tail tape measure protein [Pseudoalteromonas luteoviolacea]|uniref:phage tail tape measure protein n=1 Tax=Pseudoalteromonas luteoviolacea TaxID=43657 RepID=UPI001B38589A|nr:phage tail tape measure protein [Pseudoalteromonas luteoviolacea]MBQ4838844.1 phage tail tape measure protein [Pseudoalteromonas luteoviolacea]
MSNNEHNQEIVQLVIDAKNLSSDELTEAAEQLLGLSKTALKAERALTDIEVKQGALDSYKQLKEQLNTTRQAVAKAEVDFKKLSSSVNKNKNATDEQKQSVELAKIQIKQQRKELTDLQRTYDTSLKDIKAFGAHSRNLVQVSEQLAEAHKEQATEVQRLNAELAKQTNTVNQRIESEKRRLNVTGELNEETQKRIELERQEAEQAKQNELAARTLSMSLKQYEKRLEELNRDKKNGVISTGDYIRKEAELKLQLGLTSAQVAVSKQAIEADSNAKTKASKSTDSLTHATRRLAQIYTVLIAAQSAIEVVRQTTTAYGESEAAITKVEKTTGQAREVIAEMHKELAVLAQEIMPTSTNELARFAEIAGQLGVKSTSDLMNLVAAADALNVSTNLAGDDAATLLSRILSMTGEGIPEINNLASSVVALGNNFAIAEDEIAFMTKEIVTGTSAINVGSAAAAAFGTVLKESGQQAERSRSGFTRLSQSILQASQRGGADLERLQTLTGLTADEIEKNLGERPEEVLFKLVKGFSEAKGEGVLLSNILRDMRIDSQETLEVFEVLSNKVTRLRYAIDLSNKAYIEQTAHFEEAAKTYANQESQIARLVNQFGSLKRSAGEAFSDELDSSIRTTSELLKALDDVSVLLMNELGNLTTGFGELFDSIGLVSEVTEDFTSKALGSTLTVALANVRNLFNTLTITVKGFGLALNEIKLYLAELSGESDEHLNKIRETSRKLALSIEQDTKDIESGFKRIFNESSAAYEDFISTYEKYQNSSSQLGENQLKQLQTLVSANKYVKEHEQSYVELTAALVRANRETEIRDRMIAEQVKRDEARAQVEREEIQRTKELQAQAEKLNLTRKELVTENEKLSQSYADGKISVSEYEETLTLLSFAEGKLVEQERELALSKQLSVAENTNLSESVRELKLAEIDLESALNELDLQLNKNIKSDSEKLQLTLQRIDAERQLALVKERLRIQSELESKTSLELQLIQEKNTTAIERLTSRYKSGTITFGEYQRELDRLKITQSFLTDAVITETRVKQENTQATASASAVESQYSAAKEKSTQSVKNSIRWNRESTKAIAAHGRAVASAARHVSLFASAHEHLNKQFSFSGQSTADLRKRYDELEDSIASNNRVTSSWWRDLAQQSNVAFEREKDIISQTLHMRQWTEQVQSGSTSLEQLNKYANSAKVAFRDLGHSELTGFLNQIEQAKAALQETKSLSNELSVSTNTTQEIIREVPSETVVIRLESGGQSATAQANRQEINRIINVLRQAGLNIA